MVKANLQMCIAVRTGGKKITRVFNFNTIRTLRIRKGKFLRVFVVRSLSSPEIPPNPSRSGVLAMNLADKFSGIIFQISRLVYARFDLQTTGSYFGFRLLHVFVQFITLGAKSGRFAFTGGPAIGYQMVATRSHDVGASVGFPLRI